MGRLDLKTGQVENWSYDIAGGESLHYSPDRKRALAGRAYGVWRQDKGEIAWGGMGTTAQVDLIDMVNLKVIATLDERNPAAKDRSVVGRYWSNDSRWIATVGSDHTVRIWEGDRGKPMTTVTGHTDWILDVAFAPDGRRLVTVSNDETARLWDTVTGKQIRVFRGHTAGLNTVAFDANGERMLTGGEDETARLWDVATGKQIRAWGQHEDGVRDAGFNSDGKTIWTQMVQGRRRIWKIEDGLLVSEKKTAAADEDRFGVLYLKRTKDKGYEIWSGPRGVPGEDQGEKGVPQVRPRLTLKGDSQFRARAITADGKTAASNGPDRTVALWDIERWDKVTGEGRTFLPAQSDQIWRMAFTPDGKSLAVACEDGSLRLWDLTTKKSRVKFEGDASHVRSLVFSPDGKMLAGGGWNRALYIWQVATGELVMSKVDVTGPVHGVAFSPDGKTLASSGMVRNPDDKAKHSFYEPGIIIFWDIATGKQKQTLGRISVGGGLFSVYARWENSDRRRF